MVYFTDIKAGAMRAIAARRPGTFMAFLALANEVMHTGSSLTQLERELVGAYVSKTFGCDFCHYGHLDTAEVLGGSEARQLVDAPTDRLAVLFAFADKVVRGEVDDAAIQQVIDNGYDEKAVEDVIFVASLFGFANRMVTGFGIGYAAERDRAGSQRLANGYLWK
jgi:AhpD family alkylhydroperoxidase